jgi:hypothetical protein
MITGISIENFKGIGDRVDLELSPVTLLFGANSGGKSTVLHALHYAREIFARQNYDAHNTIGGGKFVDLGGFEKFVHGHDVARKITLGFTVEHSSPKEIHQRTWPAAADLKDVDVVHSIENSHVEIQVGYSTVTGQVSTESLSVHLNGELFATLDSSGLLVNLEHPSLIEASYLDYEDDDTISEDEQATKNAYQLYSFAFDQSTHLSQDSLPEGEDIERYTDSFLGASLSAMKAHGYFPGAEFHNGAVRLRCNGSAAELIQNVNNFSIDYRRDDIEDESPLGPQKGTASSSVIGGLDEATVLNTVVGSISSMVADIISGATRELGHKLNQLVYVGPLREKPSRYETTEIHSAEYDWSSGLGAWEALKNSNDGQVDEVGDWLFDSGCLDAGCRIELRNYVNLDLADPKTRLLLDGRTRDEMDKPENKDGSSQEHIASNIVIVPDDDKPFMTLTPHDVGMGISQVVPVIAAALHGAHQFHPIMIEQPELHLHPRLQANLADLFIDATQRKQNQFILETHSEHMVLRFQRRIRETERGTVPVGREMRPRDLAIYFMLQEEGQSKPLHIGLDIQGDFIDAWPDGFFDVDSNERFA